jgi:hypothetical protein
MGNPMTDDRFDEDMLGDAQLAQTVEEALRGLRIASSGRSEAKLRSAVAELGRRSTPLLVAPKLAVDPQCVKREDVAARGDRRAGATTDGAR